MRLFEITKSTERKILLSLRGGEKSLSQLTEEVGITKDWMIKKLNDLNERGALLEHRGPSNERFVRLSENVKFIEERDYFNIIKPTLPSLFAVIFCFILFIYGVFKPEFFEMTLVIFFGSLAGFLPSLIWMLYKTWKEPTFIRIFLQLVSNNVRK